MNRPKTITFLTAINSMSLESLLPRRLRWMRLGISSLLLVAASHGFDATTNVLGSPPASRPGPRSAAETTVPDVKTWNPVSKDSQHKKQPPTSQGELAPAGYESYQDHENHGSYGHYEVLNFGENLSPLGPAYACDTCEPRLGTPGCDPWNDACRSPTNPWVRVEYLLWSIGGSDLPPLVTTSPVGVAGTDIGVLGRDTHILFGGDDVSGDPHSGARLTIGSWIDPARTLGWELSYAGFERNGESFSASSDAYPHLARPFFDLWIGNESAFLVAVDGSLTGSVTAQLDSQFEIAEVLRREHLSSTARSRTDWLIGYRYGNFEDRLRIDQTSTFVIPQGPIIAGTTKSLFDHFETDTQFHGAVLGVDHQRRAGAWTLATLAKLSLGGNRTKVMIDGETLTTVPGGGSATFVGGLLAQQTNIGTYSESEFAVIPEFGITLKGHFSPCVQLLVGYNLLYWSGVARAGEQIDRSLSQLPPEPITGSANPHARVQSGGLFMHGLNTGLQIQF